MKGKGIHSTAATHQFCNYFNVKILHKYTGKNLRREYLIIIVLRYLWRYEQEQHEGAGFRVSLYFLCSTILIRFLNSASWKLLNWHKMRPRHFKTFPKGREPKHPSTQMNLPRQILTSLVSRKTCTTFPIHNQHKLSIFPTVKFYQWRQVNELLPFSSQSDGRPLYTTTKTKPSITSTKRRQVF